MLGWGKCHLSRMVRENVIYHEKAIAITVFNWSATPAGFDVNVELVCLFSSNSEPFVRSSDAV